MRRAPVAKRRASRSPIDVSALRLHRNGTHLDHALGSESKGERLAISRRMDIDLLSSSSIRISQRCPQSAHL
jgi:hypothetical protein